VNGAKLQLDKALEREMLRLASQPTAASAAKHVYENVDD
jgi:hypothetical protein